MVQIGDNYADRGDGPRSRHPQDQALQSVSCTEIIKKPQIKPRHDKLHKVYLVINTVFV